MNHHLITFMVFLPLVGALLQGLLPSDRGSAPGSIPRAAALIASLAASLCAVILVVSMQTQTPDPQAMEELAWVGFYSISYQMGIDGLNALVVLLVAIIFPILIAAEWDRKAGVRGMHGMLLVLQTAFFGAVCAQDLFLQFFFWGLSALPFYFLIGIWGGEDRESAAFHSMVAAAIGNAFVFASFVLIYYSVDPHTFSIHELTGAKLAGKTFEILGYTLPVSPVAFGLMSIGLAFRTPIWPLHGWFTHVAKEAPFSVLVALGGVTVPIGIYLFVRLGYSLFPDTLLAWAPFIVVVGAANLIIGGLCSVAQKELRLLLAFICLSEVGLVLVGIGSLSSAGVVGAIYQELILGLGLAGFGLLSGLIADRLGNSVFRAEAGQPRLGGVATRAPFVALVAGIVVASLLGFPGLGGFVSRALLIIGSYSAYPAAVLLSGAALLLATYYLFTMYRCVFLGKPNADLSAFHDLTLRERAYLLPLVACLLFFGLYPKPLLELVRPTVLTLLSTIK